LLRLILREVIKVHFMHDLHPRRIAKE